MTLRELLIAAVMALAMLALLPGCATVDREGWAPYATHEPLPAVVVAATAAEVRSHCPLQTTFVLGCAVRDTDHKVCVIYTDAKPLPGVLAHELMHCSGFDHGGKT